MVQMATTPEVLTFGHDRKRVDATMLPLMKIMASKGGVLKGLCAKMLRLMMTTNDFEGRCSDIVRSLYSSGWLS